MKKLIVLFVFGAVMLFVFGHERVRAQYTGPSSSAGEFSVAEVIESAQRLDRQDVRVQLEGFVTEHIREEYFWFEDGTGRIRIEIYPHVMPAEPFDETTRVILIGEVDHHLLRGPEIEVKQILFARD